MLKTSRLLFIHCVLYYRHAEHCYNTLQADSRIRGFSYPRISGPKKIWKIKEINGS